MGQERETKPGVYEPAGFSDLPRTFKPFDPASDGTKVAICICNNHPYMPDNYFWTYQRMMKPNGSFAVKGAASTKCGSLNEVTAKAIMLGAEWLFFTDVDMTFPQDVLPRLLSHGLPIVSGLYYTGSPPYAPVAGWVKEAPGTSSGYKYVNSKGDVWRHSWANFDRKLTEVDWAGAGCLLIHRDVFLDIGWAPWRDEWTPELGQRVMGHDINLCLRAKEKGYKVMLDGSVNCGHWRLQEVERLFAEATYASNFHETVIALQKAAAKEPAYWNERWHDEWLKKHQRASFYAAEHDYILKAIPQGARVIDFGSGPGEFLDLAAARRAARGTALDFSAEAIRLAKARGHDGIVADFRTYEPNGLSSSFDVAVSNHAFEHVQDPDLLVKLMTAHVRPGGLVAVSIPVLTGEGSVAEHEHVRDYTADELRASLSRHLTGVIVETVGHSHVGFGRRPADCLTNTGKET